MITEIAATLAFSATQIMIKLVLLFFFGPKSNCLFPKKENRTFYRIIRELIEFRIEKQKPIYRKR